MTVGTEPDYIIAGDPGGKGAAVRIDKYRRIAICDFDKVSKLCYPSYRKHILSTLRYKEGDDVLIYRENVHAMRGDFVNRSWTFSANNNKMLCVFEETTTRKIVLVDPQVWQRFHRLAGIPENIRKRKFQEKAIELLGYNVNQNPSDAILLALYAHEQVWGY